MSEESILRINGDRAVVSVLVTLARACEPGAERNPIQVRACLAYLRAHLEDDAEPGADAMLGRAVAIESSVRALSDMAPDDGSDPEFDDLVVALHAAALGVTAHLRRRTGAGRRA